MKKNLALAITVLLPSIFQPSFGEELDLGDIKLETSVYKQTGARDAMNRIYIEKVTVKPSRYLNTRSANKINAQLKQLSASFYAKSRQCNTPPKNIPWGYEFELSEATNSDDILTFVFDATSACSGRHSFKKVTRNFSVQTGALIPED
ncbi:hypothetical protein [Herbaspirillum frisingense]|uniref:hypothetical protein n=1 Tax=Herbaspirillum frisingense TaxID=92645 RepID=UPI001F294CE4|nr:hypothetical protein [Herbaspirillum frisingense]UIN22932.1 hypothetical protein LAZ82_07465 [Herbaspirillum frisingense]